ncbi:hypothetical protein ACIA5G_39075 [Amycolatopsis sp. NPDC051758]|uniref:hypothetical protein n=1 Tax=Amycolatopsis sp. NPDC051758 TaxID=3363935 RepID=UPI00379A1437
MATTDKRAAGSYVVAVPYQTVWAAVAGVIDALGVDTASGFKVRSGEHLAVVLASAFLGGPPIATDKDGGPDMVFDLGVLPAEWRPALTGRADARFADVEVKSLRGPVRAFDAAIDEDLAHGQEPRKRTMVTRIVSANDIVAGPGQDMLGDAAEQLQRKSSPDRARISMLIAHQLDHLHAEVLDVVIAHHLEPLTDLPGSVDAVWMLFAPTHLVVWSVVENRWTNLLFKAADTPGQPPPPGAEDGLEFLVAVDEEFRRLIGDDSPSPYAFKLIAGSAQEHTSRGGYRATP